MSVVRVDIVMVGGKEAVANIYKDERLVETCKPDRCISIIERRFGHAALEAALRELAHRPTIVQN